MAVVWQPVCAQGTVDGVAQYPTIDHTRSKAVGGLISVLAVSRGFMDKHREGPVTRLAFSATAGARIAQPAPRRISPAQLTSTSSRGRSSTSALESTSCS